MKKKSSKNSQECGKILIKFSRGLLNKCSRGTWHLPTLTEPSAMGLKNKQKSLDFGNLADFTEDSPQWAHDPGNIKKEKTKSLKNPLVTKTALTPRYSLF